MTLDVQYRDFFKNTLFANKESRLRGIMRWVNIYHRLENIRKQSDTTIVPATVPILEPLDNVPGGLWDLNKYEPVIDIYGGIDYGSYNPFNGEVMDIISYFGGDK